MCCTCYRDYGSPRVITHETRALARRLAVADSTGDLHLMVDDWMLNDDDLIGILAGVRLDHERTLIQDALSVSLDERVTAMALAEQIIEA